MLVIRVCDARGEEDDKDQNSRQYHVREYANTVLVTKPSLERTRPVFYGFNTLNTTLFLTNSLIAVASKFPNSEYLPYGPTWLQDLFG